MREAVEHLWPEIQWISDTKLREQVTQTWIKALERSSLKPDDLNQIPFTLLVPNCPITFMEHKRCVVHIAREAAKTMTGADDLRVPALPHDQLRAVLRKYGRLSR
mgnify:CR=1 FL=1